MYKPSIVRDLKNSGGLWLLIFAFVLLFAGYESYAFGVIQYPTMLGILALSVALALGADIEYRFYQLKLQLRSIERMIRDLKEHQA